MRSLIVVSFALLTAAWSPSCNPQPEPVPPTPPSPRPVVTDAGPPAPAPTPTVPPAPPPPPVGDVYDDACRNLVALGCADGAAANCAATMRRVDQAGLTVVPVACLQSAKTKAAAKACGFGCRP